MARQARKGRGRLSAIQQLPDACSAAVAQAAAELRANKRTQLEIYQDFHATLTQILRDGHGELEFEIPSSSSFNRYSMRQAAMSRRMSEAGRMATSIAKEMDGKTSDDLTIMSAEAVKTLCFELLGDENIDPKGAMQLAAALRSATQAASISTSRRQSIEGEFNKKVTDAVGKVQKVNGMTDETAASIFDLLGVPHGLAADAPTQTDGSETVTGTKP